MASTPNLILASGSRYRAELLRRLGVAFEVRAADVDESRMAGESPRALVERLAAAKADAIDAPDGTLVIGSDQVAALGDEVLGKPGDRARAVEQLQRQSGREVAFLTAVCLRYAGNGPERVETETVRVRFRTLGRREIERYVARERPFDCAGSFKSESLGVALCETIECGDPTALVGLPLIRLSAMLRMAGFELP